MATVTRIAPGTYQVDDDGRRETVYAAGRSGELWAFWNGQIFRDDEPSPDVARSRPASGGAAQVLTAPMPAKIVKVLVAPGQAVRSGETLVVLEAMKMELPLRAPGAGVVKAVHAREGELVQPDRALVELE